MCTCAGGTWVKGLCAFLIGLVWPCRGPDWFWVFCLGFLLRTARGCLLSSIMSILVGFVWSTWSSCNGSGASLGILGVPHLLIVVRRGRGWKNYQLIGLQLTQVCEPIILFLLMLSLVDQSSQFIHLDYHLAWSIRLWNWSTSELLSWFPEVIKRNRAAVVWPIIKLYNTCTVLAWMFIGSDF